jgi:hypothetical protein
MEVDRLRSELKAARNRTRNDEGRAGAVSSLVRREPRAALRPTAKALRRAKVDRAGRVTAQGPGLCGLETRPEDIDRLLGFLDALVNAVELRGISFAPVGNGMRIARGPDALTFKIKAKREHRPYEPTRGEVAREERRLRLLERQQKRGEIMDMALFQPTYPETVDVLTGAYAVVVDWEAYGSRRTWADGKTRTLETMFDAIVIGFDEHLIAARAWREQREAWDRERERNARRHLLLGRWTQRENARLQFVGQLMDRENEALRLRRWLEAAKARKDPELLAFGRLVDWATKRVEALEDMFSPLKTEKALIEENLFPEVDVLERELADIT